MEISELDPLRTKEKLIVYIPVVKYPELADTQYLQIFVHYNFMGFFRRNVLGLDPYVL